MDAAHDPAEDAPTTEPSAGSGPSADAPPPNAPPADAPCAAPANTAPLPPAGALGPPPLLAADVVPTTPLSRTSDPRKEWLAAIVLMLLIAAVFAAFVGFMRSSF